MSVSENVLEQIGNTPLVKLKRASEETGCTILGKAEFLNPGQSVKDRAALSMIRAAEKSGKLQPGGTIVEGTAGNTGIGIAMISRVLGYRSIIVIPETQTQEKKDALRLMGAELIEVPALPYKNPNNYIHVSRRLAEQIAKTSPNGAVWANQFDNVANRQAHTDTTGPEIYRDLDGKVDGFICACGSGGTLVGTSMALRERSSTFKSGIVDPDGAALYNFYANGELKSEGGSISEGIGQGRITANLEGYTPDMAFNVSDKEGLPIIFNLLQEEGLCMGLSTGINVAGAIRMAKEMGPGHTIVTILCDYGNRYQSKLYNPEFLRSKDLPVPEWMEGSPDIEIPFVSET